MGGYKTQQVGDATEFSTVPETVPYPIGMLAIPAVLLVIIAFATGILYGLIACGFVYGAAYLLMHSKQATQYRQPATFRVSPTMVQVANTSFSGIDLVTLSACQTGLSGAVRDDGREIEGFSTIVQQGGARQVVSSLWEVEDHSTASLMRGLYRSLAANGGDGAAALRQAQLALRLTQVAGHRPYDQPFYWAGFVASTR